MTASPRCASVAMIPRLVWYPVEKTSAAGLCMYFAKCNCRNSSRRRFRRPTCRSMCRQAGSGWNQTSISCRSQWPFRDPRCRRIGTATLDVAGFIRDERGAPIGRIRDTLTVKAGEDNLTSRQILYQTNVTLPPGRFVVKVVVRENGGGLTGTFETLITVPELKQSQVKVSSLVLSTQLRDLAAEDQQSAREGRHRDRPQSDPHRGEDQRVYFYYEVYEPGTENGAPKLHTSLAFYRGKVRVFETPVDRAHANRRRRPQGRAVSVRTARRQPDARSLHLSGQHHRRSQRPLRVPAPADVRPVNHGHKSFHHRATKFAEIISNERDSADESACEPCSMRAASGPIA